MERATWVDAVARESAALVAAAAAADPRASCPSCPEWTATDLLRHVGQVHGRFARSVSSRSTERPRRPDPPPEAELAEWVASGASTLVELLRRAEELPEVWTWAGPRPVSWVARRMAQETVVHRWDAQGCVGAADPIEAALAADCVDEFLHVFVPRFTPRAPAGGPTLRVCAADVGREWVVSSTGEPAPPDAPAPRVVVSGTASELALAVWGRTAPAALRVHGDERPVVEWFGWLADVCP